MFDPEAALTTLGRALQVTMANIFQFGLLTATAIVLALAADYFLAPALMILAFKDRPIVAAD